MFGIMHVAFTKMTFFLASASGWFGGVLFFLLFLLATRDNGKCGRTLSTVGKKIKEEKHTGH